MKHTKEPCVLLHTTKTGRREISAQKWEGLAKVYKIVDGHLCLEGVANSRRIVAALNACAGISTEALNSGIIEKYFEVICAAIDGLTEPDGGHAVGDGQVRDIVAELKKIKELSNHTKPRLL